MVHAYTRAGIAEVEVTMINVTCFKCGWKFTLDEEAIAESLAEAETSPPRHYVVECPRCRQANKVSLKRVGRRGRAVRRRG
jgi:phage FluMu protein Com